MINVIKEVFKSNSDMMKHFRQSSRAFNIKLSIKMSPVMAKPIDFDKDTMVTDQKFDEYDTLPSIMDHEKDALRSLALAEISKFICCLYVAYLKQKLNPSP